MIANHEQKPDVRPMSLEVLTMAYGAWAMPEVVARLDLREAPEVHEKAIIALGELFQIHERVAEGVKAGALPAVLALLPNAVNDPLARIRTLSVLELASRNTLGREAMTQRDPVSGAENPALAVLKDYLQDDDDQVRQVVARTVQNLCATGEGCQAVFEAKYLIELIRAVRADAGERVVLIQEIHIVSLTGMLTRCRSALVAAAKEANPKEMVTLLKLELQRGEEFLCKALDLLIALAGEDVGKDKLIGGGGVTLVCQLLHGAKAPPMGVKAGDDGPLALSQKISWKAKAKLWHLLASLTLKNEGKCAVVDEHWLRLILSALNEKDSVLALRAAIQTVLHVADDPRARKVLKFPLCPVLKVLTQKSNDAFVKKVAEKAILQLEWSP